MTNLAGHDMAALVEAFDAAAVDDAPHCFVAYTIKGLEPAARRATRTITPA